MTFDHDQPGETLRYPPRRTQSAQREATLLLAALSSCTDRHSATYVAGPITSGRRFLDWYQAQGASLTHDRQAYREAHLSAVIRPNILYGASVAATLRQRKERVVIEPFSLTVADWTQADYLHFWSEVIEQLVAEVYLLDGWSASVGSSYECLTALSIGMPVYCGGHCITPRDAMVQIDRDRATLDAAGLETAFLARIAKELTDVAAK